MERETIDIACFIIVFFVGLAFVLDLLGVSWSMIRNKPYKSLIGSFIENFLDYRSLFWLPIVIAVLFAYFFLVTHPY